MILVKSRIAVAPLALALLVGACGVSDSAGSGGVSPDPSMDEEMERDALSPADEGTISALDDDASPQPEPEAAQVLRDGDEWTVENLVVYPMLTFEDAARVVDQLFTGTIVAVGEKPVWNTENGEQGRLSEWADTSTQPMHWQTVSVLVEQVVTGSMKPGSEVELAYWVASPGFAQLEASAVEAEVLIGAESVPVIYRDGSERDVLWMDPTVTYISFGGGPALKLYSPVNGHTWEALGGVDREMPEFSSLSVVRSIDELIERALSPSDDVAQHLGYAEIHFDGVRPSPASDIVP